MRQKDEQFLRENLRDSGWSDNEIDTFIEDEMEEEELLEEDECFFDRFMEAHVENN